eukprot:TRINITY_DN1203_c0_g1_i10.p1 TRINITY_DN1203_c0_g1~~TRINITY_DN1203_c0_g1_i10.p1  ORF type:complete len:446 (+),score=48.92 TRINITY_DN1203_c0_g1_i10:1202-2539(+)
MLLRGTLKKGDLYGVQRANSKPVLYKAYFKNGVLYLLSPDESKIARMLSTIFPIDLICLESFFASKTEAIQSHPYGFELSNEGSDVTIRYYFYSDSDKDLQEWIALVNTFSNNNEVLLGNLEQKETIGTGKYSTVYRYVDKVTKMEYAMKCIEKAKLDPMERRLLQNEISIIKDLRHKNVSRCIDVYENQTHVKILMELVTGGELYEFVKKKVRLTEFEVAYIMLLVLQGLEYLHQRGIVHRDLKPENILLELDETKQHIVTLKLADFGLSLVLEPGNKVFAPCGTPVYVAPEIIRREGCDHQADLWNLGVTAFLLQSFAKYIDRIRGNFPFYAENRRELLNQIMWKELEFDSFWEGTSKECKDFIGKLLTRDPSKRMTAKAALSHPWLVNNYDVLFLQLPIHIENIKRAVQTLPKQIRNNGIHKVQRNLGFRDQGIRGRESSHR